MDSYERVHEYLSKLGMTTMESIIDSYLETSHDKPVMDILDNLLSEELRHKLSKKTENMLNWSGFPFRKTIDDFDFSFQPSIDRSVMDDLMTMRYIHNNENVVFLGPPGVGKTHLSVALGMRAVMSDIPVYYISALKLVQTLKRDYDLKRLEYRIKTYSRFRLISVDSRYPAILSKFMAVFLQYCVSAVISKLSDLLEYPYGGKIVFIYQCMDLVSVGIQL